MYVDFKKTAQMNQLNKSITLPGSLIDEFNQHLPKGLSYKEEKKGFLVIDPNTIETIDGLKPCLTETQEKVLGKAPSFEELRFFANNSQQKITMTPEVEGKIVINGEMIDLKDFVLHPFKNIDIENEVIYLLPDPFPPGISIELSSGKYTRKVCFERVPMESLSIVKFQTSDWETLDFQIENDVVKQKIKFGINTRMNNVKTVKDIVETISIYNAFYEGKGLFAGEIVNHKFSNPEESPFTNSIVLFWEKVLAVESVLKINFVPTLDPVDYETTATVERLFQGIVNNQPFKSREKINSVTRKCLDDDFIDRYLGTIGYFEFDSVINYSIFKTKIELPAIVGMFNTKIVRFSNINKGKEQVIFFDDASEQDKRFCVIKLFKNDEERSTFQKYDRKKIIKVFSKAKSIEEYMNY